MRRCFVLGILVLALSAQSAFAWGEMGHRIVCRIAQRELTSTQRRELDRLAQLYHKHGVDYPAFPHACFFPDQVKDLPAFASLRDVHFINVPRSAETVDAGDSSCAPAGTTCVLEGIAKHEKSLRDANNDVARAEALFFVGHWLGDVHQPLHVSFADDRGGGRVVVASDFYPDSNLHSVWDTGIIRDAIRDIGWKAYANQLQADVTDEEREQWLASSEPLEWAQESYEITLRDDVDYCRMSGGQCRRETHERELTEDYQELFLPVVEMRLKQAGVRLAAELRRLLFTGQ